MKNAAPKTTSKSPTKPASDPETPSEATTKTSSKTLAKPRLLPKNSLENPSLSPLSRVLRAVRVLAWALGGFILASLLSSLLAFAVGFCKVPTDGSSVTCSLSTFQELVFDIFVYAFSVFFIVFLPGKLKKTWRATREELALSALPSWLDILLSVASLVVSLFLFYLLNQLFLNFPWYNPSEAQDVGFNSLISPFDRVFAFLALCVVAPIAEEITFRGWLYGKLKKYLPRVPAALLVSLAFAFMHGQWNAALATFSLSLVLCVARELTSSLSSGILTHMLYNILGFLSTFYF